MDQNKYTSLLSMQGILHGLSRDAEQDILKLKLNQAYPDTDWWETIILPHMYAANNKPKNERTITEEKYSVALSRKREKGENLKFADLDITVMTSMLLYDDSLHLNLRGKELKDVQNMHAIRNRSVHIGSDMQKLVSSIEETLNMLCVCIDDFHFLDYDPKLARSIYSCCTDYWPENEEFKEKLEMAENLSSNYELYKKYYQEKKLHRGLKALEMSRQLYIAGDRQAIHSAEVLCIESEITLENYVAFIDSLNMDENARLEYHVDTLNIFANLFLKAVHDDDAVIEIRNLSKIGVFDDISSLACPLINRLSTSAEREAKARKALNDADNAVIDNRVSDALDIYRELAEAGSEDACSRLNDLCRRGQIEAKIYVQLFENVDQNICKKYDIDGARKLQMALVAANKSAPAYNQLINDLKSGVYSEVAVNTVSAAIETTINKWNEIKAREIEVKKAQNEAKKRADFFNFIKVAAVALVICLLVVSCGVRSISKHVKEKQAARELEYNSQVFNFMDSGLYRGSICRNGIYYDLSLLVRDQVNKNGTVSAILEIRPFPGEITPIDTVYIGNISKNPHVSFTQFSPQYQFSYSDKWDLSEENAQILLESWDKVNTYISETSGSSSNNIPTFKYEKNDENSGTLYEDTIGTKVYRTLIYHIGSTGYDNYISSLNSKESVLAGLNPHNASNIVLYTANSPNDVLMHNGDVTSEAFFLNNYSNEVGSVSFDLNGAYSQLSFEIDYPEFNSISSGYLEILGDGEILKNGDLAKEHFTVDLDVSGINELQFNFDTKRGGWCFGGSSAAMYNFKLS